MGVRLLSFVIWALVAASAAFWAMRLGASATPVPAHAVWADADTTVAPADLGRLFGLSPSTVPVDSAPPPPPAASSRFKLIGVVAPRSGGPEGLALMAVDGAPPRAYRVAAQVGSEWIVRSIGHRRVELAPAAGGSAVVLELPLLADAARGALPSASPNAPRPMGVAPIPSGTGGIMPPGHRVTPMRAPAGAVAVPPSIRAVPPAPAPDAEADERAVQPGVETQ